MTTLKQQIENAKLTYPDPQVGEHLIDAAIDARLDEILENPKCYHELIEIVAMDHDVRREVKEMAARVRADHSSVTTSEEMLVEALVVAANGMAERERIDAATDVIRQNRSNEILDDADKYHELLEEVAKDPAARRAAREMVKYVRNKHSSVTTSEQTLVVALVFAASELAEEDVMEGRWPPEEEDDSLGAADFSAVTTLHP